MQVQDKATSRVELSGQDTTCPARPQGTLAGSFALSGVGLHSGQVVNVRVSPADPNRGRYFIRTDLPGKPEISAIVANVGQTLLSTELTQSSATVKTVEHLLAALTGMGIDNAQIEMDGPEVPLLDGSSLSWVNAIKRVGTTSQPYEQVTKILVDPVHVCHQDSFVAAFPAVETRLTYGVDFADYPVIGNQWHSFSFNSNQLDAKHSELLGNAFQNEIAPARTFGFADQIEHLKAKGLIQGGSLENALVCASDGWVNPPLRFSNEPVRHKLLDLIGDLSLLGSLPRVHVFAYKASHFLHTQLAQRLSEVLVV